MIQNLQVHQYLQLTVLRALAGTVVYEVKFSLVFRDNSRLCMPSTGPNYKTSYDRQVGTRGCRLFVLQQSDRHMFPPVVLHFCSDGGNLRRRQGLQVAEEAGV